MIQLHKESAGEYQTLSTHCQYECQDQDRYDVQIYAPCNGDFSTPVARDGVPSAPVVIMTCSFKK
jgi:hypothetical protein